MNGVQNVAKTIIIDECKELINTINIIPKDSAAIVSLGLTPYIALVVNESLEARGLFQAPQIPGGMRFML